MPPVPWRLWLLPALTEKANFIPLISLLSSELEKNRINMINDLKSILLKSSEEVEVFIKIFESWVTKLPSISGPLNLYIPTSFKDKSIEVESYFVDKSIWNVHISYHDDKRFVFFTDQFIIFYFSGFAFTAPPPPFLSSF